MSDISILPLTQVDRGLAGALFDEQCEEWLSKLRWDYAEPSRMLRGVLQKGELKGLIAIADASASKPAASGKAAAGFSFYVVEGTRASIGDIYVSPKFRGAGVDSRLALEVLSYLETVPRLRRIESQSVSFSNRGADEVFVSRGFERFERRFMIARLSPQGMAGTAEKAGNLGTGLDSIKIRPWHEDDYSVAVGAIFKSYRGEPDSRINSQYSSEEGCAELLSILTDTLWCGQFLPEASRVAACDTTGSQVGVLICSRMSQDTAHLGQISVLPGYQGRGIGRRLIQSTKTELCMRGFAFASLAVTATNSRALSLYESCGFSTVHSFPVYYWRRK